MDLMKFDGRGGPIQFEAFHSNLKDLRTASGNSDEKMKAIMSSALKPQSPAWLFYHNTQRRSPEEVDTFDKMLKKFQDKYRANLPLETLFMEERKLIKEGNEKSDEFYLRCEHFHLNKDFNISADERAEEGYKRQLDRRIRDSFLKGLPSQIIHRLGNLDVYNATSQEVLQEVEKVMKTDVGSVDVYAVEGDSAAEQEVAAFSHNRRSNNNQRQNQQGSYNNASAKRPSFEELKARKKLQCHRCKMLVKHRAAECRVKLDANGKPLSRRSQVKVSGQQ